MYLRSLMEKNKKTLIININNPERPTIGTPVSVNGKWFQNVQDVVYQGRKMDFTLISSTELQFIVPADLTKGGLLEITTNGGTISKNLDISYNILILK